MSVSAINAMFSIAYSQPKSNINMSCSSISGIYEDDLTDTNGVALKYSEDLGTLYYKGKPYTGIVKGCENGKIISITTYSNGKIEGDQYGYGANGKLSFRRTYGKNTSEPVAGYDEKNHLFPIYDEGILEGEEIMYFENGNVRFKGLYKNNLREGKWFFYDEEGKVKTVRIYESGVIIGCSGKCDW